MLNVTHSIYDSITGRFTGQILNVPADSLYLNIPAGCSSVEGTHDYLSKSVDMNSGTIVEFIPPNPSVDCAWDVSTRRWILSDAARNLKSAKAAALSAIQILESTQARTVREAALGQPGAVARLQLIDSQIVTLRLSL